MSYSSEVPIFKLERLWLTRTALMCQGKVKTSAYTLRVSPSSRTKKQLQQEHINSHTTQKMIKVSTRICKNKIYFQCDSRCILSLLGKSIYCQGNKLVQCTFEHENKHANGVICSEPSLTNYNTAQPQVWTSGV